jgi:ADP-ribose pyrophosphatase YjhB (NUDIX family)
MTNMNYCSQCGSPVSLRIPEGDHLPRYVCSACSTIHYENPKLVVGCVPVWENKILLCRRAIEPQIGLWTFPAGFMENGETAAEAAIRETLEEASARVALGPLYALYNLPHISQVYLFFRAGLTDLDFGPGPESQDVRLFTQGEIPWDDIAFTTVRDTLEHYFEDARRGLFGFHMADILPATEQDRHKHFNTVVPFSSAL